MRNPLPIIQARPPEAGGPRIVEVEFKGTRRDYFRYGIDGLAPGEYVVVEADRGTDLGRIRSAGAMALKKCGSCDDPPAARPAVIRRAEPEEVQRLRVLRTDEERIRRTSRKIVASHGLKMKVTEAEWQWDRKKLLIYFTADRRVDFRQLVRDLARTFRTRIELRQIGVRDEAALLGGIGRCGRELCCSTWLNEPRQVSLQIARDQNLSLNPQQISGTCGRLMCCLTYEHDAYLQARKRFPREGRVLSTAEGRERVLHIDIWRERIVLGGEEGERRTVTLEELRTETNRPQPSGKGERPPSDRRRDGRD